MDLIADTAQMHMKQQDTLCLNALVLYIIETNHCRQTLIHITTSTGATTTVKTYSKFYTPGIYWLSRVHNSNSLDRYKQTNKQTNKQGKNGIMMDIITKKYLPNLYCLYSLLLCLLCPLGHMWLSFPSQP